MFNYLFKRGKRIPLGAMPGTMATSPAATPAAKTATLAGRKQAALTRAEALAGDETAAVEFILQCEFADARAVAAQHVQSLPMLERLLGPMRQTDRRVARLVQQRLEALAQQQRATQQAQACLESAQRLLEQPHLLPNQVAGLDRAWQAIVAVAPELQGQFQALRAALEARLLAQAALQRAALDTLACWRQLQDTLNGADPLPSADEISRALAILEKAMANHLASPEAASLPQHLQRDFEQQKAAFQASWQRAQQLEAGRGARRRALAEWQAAAPAVLSAAELRRAWQAMPALPKDDQGCQEGANLERQFQALLRVCGDGHSPQDDDRARQSLLAALSALEAALEHGGLQEALDCDARLRAADSKAISLAAAERARLAAARAELARLRGWARWGGTLSRAELVQSAQELPGQALAPRELAQRVGALRTGWKSLDASAGPAPRELWQQFDAACSAAYMPAAEHFRRQAEQRRQHLVQAEALLEQVRLYAGALQHALDDGGGGRIDWKDAALFCTHMRQAWRQLGNPDRKDRKRLEREFEAALQVVSQPLGQQQAAEAARREDLIAAALELNPAARDTPQVVRTLRQRWQEAAQALPLEHRQEQQLWQRFHAACDAVFAQRKQVNASAEQERHHSLQQKEAWCRTLEDAVGENPASMRRLIAQDGAAWARIGAVPRALEDRINQRHATALASLREQLQRGRHELLTAGFDALRSKLALCQELEQALADGQPWPAVEHDHMQARWLASAPLAARFEQALCGRLETAQKALRGADRGYAEVLANNHAPLLQEILQLEILCGVDSPPSLARQRLQLQVEVLAAKLKTGDPVLAAQAQLLALCRLPALCDPESKARIVRLLARCAEIRLDGIVPEPDAAARNQGAE